MIRNAKEWREFCQRGTSGDMVFDILADWDESIEAAQRVCKIYFDIASNAIGEDAVRKKRDEIINQISTKDKGVSEC